MPSLYKQKLTIITLNVLFLAVAPFKISAMNHSMNHSYSKSFAPMQRLDNLNYLAALIKEQKIAPSNNQLVPQHHTTPIYLLPPLTTDLTTTILPTTVSHPVSKRIVQLLNQNNNPKMVATACNQLADVVFRKAESCKNTINPAVKSQIAASINTVANTRCPEEFIFHMSVVDHLLSDIYDRNLKNNKQPIARRDYPQLVSQALCDYVLKVAPSLQPKSIYGLLTNAAYFVCDATLGKLYLTNKRYNARLDRFFNNLTSQLQDSSEHGIDLAEKHWNKVVASPCLSDIKDGLGLQNAVSYITQLYTPIQELIPCIEYAVQEKNIFALETSFSQQELANNFTDITHLIDAHLHQFNHSLHPQHRSLIENTIKDLRKETNPLLTAAHIIKLDTMLRRTQDNIAFKNNPKARWQQHFPSSLAKALIQFFNNINVPILLQEKLEFFIQSVIFSCDVTLGKFYLSPEMYQQRVDEFWQTIDAASAQSFAEISQWAAFAGSYAAQLAQSMGIEKSREYLKQVELVADTTSQSFHIADVFKQELDKFLAQHPILVTGQNNVVKSTAVGIALLQDVIAKSGGLTREVINSTETLKASLYCEEGFLPDTLVNTTNGLKPISELTLQDKVVVPDPLGNQCEKVILAIAKKQMPQHFAITVGNDVIYAAPKQQFYVLHEDKYITAAEIKPGQTISRNRSEQLFVDKVATITKPTDFYYITVDGHVFCITPQNIDVHNFEPITVTICGVVIAEGMLANVAAAGTVGVIAAAAGCIIKDLFTSNPSSPLDIISNSTLDNNALPTQNPAHTDTLPAQNSTYTALPAQTTTATTVEQVTNSTVQDHEAPFFMSEKMEACNVEHRVQQHDAHLIAQYAHEKVQGAKMVDTALAGPWFLFLKTIFNAACPNRRPAPWTEPTHSNQGNYALTKSPELDAAVANNSVTQTTNYEAQTEPLSSVTEQHAETAAEPQKTAGLVVEKSKDALSAKPAAPQTNNANVPNPGLMPEDPEKKSRVTDKAKNMHEVFEKCAVGKLLKENSEKTKHVWGKAPIYRTTKKIPEYGMKKGDHFYLDTTHGDHIEVFAGKGEMPIRTILNLNGTTNFEKLKVACDRTLAKYIR